MRMMRICALFICAALAFAWSGAYAQDTGKGDQIPFSVGEKLRYAILAKRLYVGTQTIELRSVATYRGREVFRLWGLSKTSPFVSIFYRIDDKWDVFIDRSTLLPLRMEKDEKEGRDTGYFIYNIDQEGRSVTIRNVPKNETRVVAGKNDIFDLFTLIYYYRKYHDRFDDTFTFDFLEPKSLRTVHFKNEGIVEIEAPRVVKNWKFPAYKMRQIGGVGIEIYVSADEFRLPLKMVVPSELPRDKKLIVEFDLEKFTPGEDQGDLPWYYRHLRF